MARSPRRGPGRLAWLASLILTGAIGIFMVSCRDSGASVALTGGTSAVLVSLAADEAHDAAPVGPAHGVSSAAAVGETVFDDPPSPPATLLEEPSPQVDAGRREDPAPAGPGQPPAASETPSPVFLPAEAPPTPAPPAATVAPPGPTATPKTDVAERAEAAPSSRGAPLGRRVGLQAGHWRYWEMSPPLGARGTAGGGKTEPEVNLDIAQRVSAILTTLGYVVDVLPANMPHDYRADAVVAIHADGANSTARRGFFVDRWQRLPATGPEERLRRILDETYAAATGLRYVYSGTPNSQHYYGYSRVARGTPMVLIEGGFLTNAQDREILVGQPQRAAKGIADGIVRFLAR